LIVTDVGLFQTSPLRHTIPTVWTTHVKPARIKLGRTADKTDEAGNGHMSIRKKITIFHSVLIALILASVAISLINVRLMERMVHVLTTDTLPGIYSIGRLGGTAKDIRDGIRQHITAFTLDDKRKAEADLERLNRELHAEIQAYQETINNPRESELFAKVPDALESLRQTMVPIRPVSLRGRTNDALTLFFSQTIPAYRRVQQAIEENGALQSDEASHDAARATASARWVLAGTGVLLMLALLCGSVIVSLHRLLIPLKDLIDFTGRVGRGDFSATAPVKTPDEIGELTAAFNRMVTGLRAAQQRLSERTEQLEISNAQLEETQERYRLAVGGAKDGIWDWDVRSQQVYFSPRWKAMLGYVEDEIRSEIDEWRSRIHPDDRERVEKELATHFHGDVSHFESEHRMLHKDGSYRWMLSRAQAVRQGDGAVTRMAGSQTDITDNKVLDPLTGLPNRILFKEKLAISIERARRRPDYRFAVFFLDLDGFKLVNDSLGHAVGDQLLISIAQRIRFCVRSGDCVARPFDSTAARLGGDEFALLLEDVNGPESAIRVAERVLQELSSPFDLLGHHLFASASIGIALGGGGDQKPEDLLRDVDLAMYRAKAQGKARYELFDARLRENAMARLEMETDLRGAVEGGQFIVQYQPEVSLRDEPVLEFEALIRWRHPVRGLIPPLRFIPLAEETGLIVPIGKWVLREACRQTAEWQRRYPHAAPVKVSVNLSARQFREPDLIDQVAGALLESGLERGSLDLEITESTIMENPETALSTFAKLKEMGVGLSMDDFGTGYSSLNCLHQFPFDTLKIDRTFVEHMQADSESAEIVGAVINLGNRLGMRVIAEGIETGDQLARLRALGCGYGQGYYFAKPMDAERAEALIGKFATERQSAPGANCIGAVDTERLTSDSGDRMLGAIPAAAIAARDAGTRPPLLCGQ